MKLAIIFRIAPFALIAVAPLAAVAAEDHINMPGMNLTKPSSAVSTLTDGEVRKVDADQGKITIKHGAIENLGMPGMTMVFRVADPSMLARVKPGDNIKFAADRLNGNFTLVRLEP